MHQADGALHDDAAVVGAAVASAAAIRASTASSGRRPRPTTQPAIPHTGQASVAASRPVPASTAAAASSPSRTE